jgi:CHAT domain-containing protein/tetratricopeptide (TPR) repeat protein
MDHATLLAQLIATEPFDQLELLARYPSLCDVKLARALHAAGQAAWNSEPTRMLCVASALRALAERTSNAEIIALAEWMDGIAALIEGRMENALMQFDRAAQRFEALGLRSDAAATRVPKLMALGMLARFDEAIETGLCARDQFVALGDELSAGKAELNLGHIYFRRDAYAEAERCYWQAYERFSRLQDTERLIAVQIALADVMAWQHRFGEAARLYAQAEGRAEAVGLSVLQATSALNAGHLALLQGQYDRALRDLERARRLYERLALDNDVALCEQKIADAYLQLNLIPEAIEIYARIVPRFAEAGLSFEQAWALAHFGRALLQAGRISEARRMLSKARTLFCEQGNSVSEAIATLALAQVEFTESRFDHAADLAWQAETAFQTGRWRSWLGEARWLRAECERRAGNIHSAQRLLEAALDEAIGMPHIVQRCQAALGAIALSTGDSARAEKYFMQAVALAERQRARLPGEEFRAAFLADKLAPYVGLMRLHLDATPPNLISAFDFAERLRSRTLLEAVRGELSGRKASPAEDDALLRQSEALRVELNWLYAQLQAALSSRSDPARLERLREAAQERERKLLDLLRRTQHARSVQVDVNTPAVSLLALHEALGEHTAVVAYTALDDDLIAFVVADGHLHVHRGLANISQLEATIAQLSFQIEAMRYGAERMRIHLPQLLKRARHYLGRLYQVLLRPILSGLGERRLVVVPDRALHYVPFHALWDGEQYLIEQREVCVVPSAAMLMACLSQPWRNPNCAVLVGVPDARAPKVQDEVMALAQLFHSSQLLIGDYATLAALQNHASQADVLHLACHGQFRPDNPLFSSLMLADGWLTVRDAYQLELRGTLVTLSACETGMNRLAPGNEIVGLARGFFAAGASSLVVSLWVVDDVTTVALMERFYARLLAGNRPAAALRDAQLHVLREQPHPFFWAPFVLFGRW